MTKRKPGNAEVIVGPMFSGKSEELIRRLRRAKIARQKLQVFKPQVDDRYSKNKVVSHVGNEFNATPIDDIQKVYELLADDTTVVAIDEAQFFDWKVADVVQDLVERGIRVIIAGLDMDFRGEPFGPIPILLTQAEDVQKLTAICIVCGDEATRTQRLIDGRPARSDDPIILVGGTEEYQARCRWHHEVPTERV